MIVDKIWKLTNVVRVRLDPPSSHSQWTTSQTFHFKVPDNVCSYSPPVRSPMSRSSRNTNIHQYTHGHSPRWFTPEIRQVSDTCPICYGKFVSMSDGKLSSRVQTSLYPTPDENSSVTNSLFWIDQFFWSQK